MFVYIGRYPVSSFFFLTGDCRHPGCAVTSHLLNESRSTAPSSRIHCGITSWAATTWSVRTLSVKCLTTPPPPPQWNPLLLLLLLPIPPLPRPGCSSGPAGLSDLGRPGVAVPPWQRVAAQLPPDAEIRQRAPAHLNSTQRRWWTKHFPPSGSSGQRFAPYWVVSEKLTVHFNYRARKWKHTLWQQHFKIRDANRWCSRIILIYNNKLMTKSLVVQNLYF